MWIKNALGVIVVFAGFLAIYGIADILFEWCPVWKVIIVNKMWKR